MNKKGKCEVRSGHLGPTSNLKFSSKPFKRTRKKQNNI